MLKTVSIPSESPCAVTLQFLDWWLAQAMSDEPEPVVTYKGLCSNFRFYCLDRKLFSGDFGPYFDTDYPFGGETRFSIDSMHCRMHKNEARLGWVRAVLEKYGNGS